MEIKKINFPVNLNFFRFERVEDNKYLLTTDTGDYIFLEKGEFVSLLQSKLTSELKEKLENKNILIVDLDRIIWKYRSRYSFLFSGPILHIIVLTLRCNEKCKYCQVSRVGEKEDGYDMDIVTAKRVVDFIFKVAPKGFTIEFQGGEPLLNWEVLSFIVEYVREKERLEERTVTINLVTNLSLMDDEKLKFLVENNVYICTSLDGPPSLHDQLRPLLSGSSYDVTVYWIKRINQYYKEIGLDPRIYHVDALMTTTKLSFDYWKEIIDTYVELGLNTIHLRPLSPLGIAQKHWAKLGYSVEEFISYYVRSFDYIMELNLNGIELIERGAAIRLSKILQDLDPGYVDLRSPCGAGIGQLAYNYNGDIYSCDEGRMLARQGDLSFKIGNINDKEVNIYKSDVVKICALASCTDSLPYCKDCVFKPYCGVCPVFEYVTQGTPFGPKITSSWCKLNRAIFRYLFTYLEKDDKKILDLFYRWTLQRER